MVTSRRFPPLKSSLSTFLIFSILFLQQIPLLTIALAADNPWAESPDFSLTKQEKLTNTGFETNLDGWTASPHSVNDNSLVGADGLVASWPLDDTTAAQSYARVVNPADSEGRNIVLNGAFDSDTVWTKGSGWTIANGVATANNPNSGLSQTVPIVIGKAYQFTFTISNYSGSGTIRPFVGATGGTDRSADGTYTETIIPTSGTTIMLNGGATFVGDIDNVSVKQLNIPATPVVTSTELLTDGDMEDNDGSPTSSWTVGNAAALTKNTSSPHGGSQVLRVTRNGVSTPYAYQPNSLTIGQVYRFTGFARGDGNVAPGITDGYAQFWTGTTSTTWQPFDVVRVAAGTRATYASNATVDGRYGDFDDVSVTLDTSIRQGELTIDGNMEYGDSPNSWTDTNHYWKANSAATISKQTTNPHGGASLLRVASSPGDLGSQARQDVLVPGKTYRATGYARVQSGASAILWAGSTGNSTVSTSTSWTYFEKTFVAPDSIFMLGAGGDGLYSEWDDISVTEVNPLVGKNTNGVTVGSTASGHLTNAYTFDGTNDNVNIYSTDLNSVFNPSEGTLVAWAKVANENVWSDATNRQVISLFTDINNLVYIYKSTTNNQVVFRYYAGGTVIAPAANSISGTGWKQYVLTWSKSSDQVKAYINGVQVGTTLTGLGTWVGNLSSTQTTIGAYNTTGTINPWSGSINDTRLYSRALSPTEIANLYSGGTATRDTGTKYAGTASSKLISYEGYNSTFVQSVNVGNTQTYQLEAYAYIDGSTAVTDDYAELYYNGAAITTAYEPVGSGWYKLTGTVTGANESRDYGVIVKADKTVYVDNFSLWNYPASDSLTSSVFDSEITGGAAWGTLAYTSSGSTVAVKVRTSNSSAMTGATDFSLCAAISSGSDVSTNSCVTDGDRYAQYEVTLSTSDHLVTPTLNDFSLTFGVYDSEGPVFVLDSPGDNTYTNNDRPTFRWKTASDALSTVTDYDLIISPPVDSGKSVLVLSDIPINRTADYETAKYLVHYDGFDDQDSDNNYISVYTKSSNTWSADTNHNENDGKLVEGKTTWSVKATDSAGNQTSHSRALLVDRTAPSVTLTSINNVASSTGSFATNDTTPTLKINISDPTSAEVSSGPSEVSIQIDKKNGLIYSPVIIYKQQNTSSETDYTTQNLKNGTYRIVLDAKDKAGNSSSSQTYNLQIGSYAAVAANVEPSPTPSASEAPTPGPIPRLATPTPSPTPEPEVTVPVKETGPSVFEQAGEQIGQFAGSVGTGLGNLVGIVFAGIDKAVGGTLNIAATVARAVGGGIIFVARGMGNGIAFVWNGVGNIYNGIANAAPGAVRNVLLAVGNVFTGTTTAIATLAGNASTSIGTGVTSSFSAFQNAIASAAFTVGQKVGNISHGVGTAIIKVGYLFVPEPTTISDVKVASSTPTSITITWNTNHPANGKVNYGLTPDYGQDVQTEKRTTQHEFTITGLTPNTTYHYEVMSQNRNYVYDANHTFATPAD